MSWFYVTLVLSDAHIGGQGGLLEVPTVMTEEDIHTLYSMMEKRAKIGAEWATIRTGELPDFILKTSTGCVIDTRCVVALTVDDIEGEDDDGGGPELEEDDEKDDKENKARARFWHTPVGEG